MLCKANKHAVTKEGEIIKDLISKKELLQITGISYGQLYRWKRENLIPEEWFMKQSAFTGQETFFPREKMLKRVEAIQSLKDNLSLEEIARLLSPELTDKLFQNEDLSAMEELDKCVVNGFVKQLGKSTFTYFEVLLMQAFSIYKNENRSLTEPELNSMIFAVRDWFRSINGTSYTLAILEKDGGLYVMIHQLQAQVLLDSRFKTLRSFHLDEISDDIRMKYDRRS